MAQYKIECPECETILRPTKPLQAGKKVKCPKCGNTFAAPAQNAAPAKAAAKKKTSGKGSDEDNDSTYAVADDGIDQEVKDAKKPKINYAPDMSIKDLRGPAQALLIPPSNKLIMVGVIGFIGWLGLIVALLIAVFFPVPEYKGVASNTPTKKAGEEEKKSEFFKVMEIDLAPLTKLVWYLFLAALAPMILGMLYSGLMTLGAVKMQNLESRGWGIAACIMSILPFNLLGFIVLTWLVVQFVLLMVIDGVEAFLIGLAALEALAGVGVGIWGLTVLMKQEVIDGFNYEAE
jgi:predicted Zn finger-like uncharacterized protein